MFMSYIFVSAFVLVILHLMAAALFARADKREVIPYERSNRIYKNYSHYQD